MTPDEVLDLVWLVEGEVNNGGFDQFFFNSSGAESAKIVEALDLIGAHTMAAIVRRACAKFPGGMPPTDHDERWDVLTSLWPEQDAFDAETREFQDYPDDVGALLAAFALTSGLEYPPKWAKVTKSLPPAP